MLCFHLQLGILIYNNIEVIRKILLLCIVVAVALWVVGAHLIKGKIVDKASQYNSDNIKLQFQDAKIFGFPFAWKIKLLSPKLTIVNQNSLKEISAEEIILSFGYSFTSATINLGRKIVYSEAHNGIMQTYTIITPLEINSDISFNNSLFFVSDNSNWKEQLKSFSSVVPQVSGFLEDKEVFNLAAVKLYSIQEKKDDNNILRIKASGDCSSAVRYMEINKAHLLIDVGYHEVLENESEKRDFERKFDLSNFQLKFDNASLDIKGVVRFSRSSLPQGKLDVAIHQYHDVVDALIPEGFIFSKSFFKKVISKATATELNKDDIANASFKIIFSDKGVTIGNLNLMELQAD